MQILANKALHWMAIPLRSIATSELDRYALKHKMKNCSVFITRLGEITKALLIIFAVYSVILPIVVRDIESTFFMLQETLAIPFWAFPDPKIGTTNMAFIITFGFLSKIASERKRFIADLSTSICWLIYSVGLLSMMT